MERKLIKRLAFIFILLMLSLCFGGWSIFRNKSISRTTTLKFGHTDATGGTRDKAANVFAEKVDKYTNGAYKVEVFAAGTLGNDDKLLELVKLGALDFVVTGAAIYGKQHKSMSLTLCPFIVESLEQGWHLYDDSKWVQDRFKELEDLGYKMLATWEAGFRCLTTKEKILGPADVKGMKLRVPPNPIHLAIWETLGAKPVSMGINEVYMAIQTGVVDGQENPIPTIHANRFYEVAKNITITNHVYGPIPLSISMVTWKEIPEKHQKAILRAAKEASKYSRDLVVAEMDGMLADMKKSGADVIIPDFKLWHKAALPAYDRIKELFGVELVESLMKEAEAIKAKYPVK